MSGEVSPTGGSGEVRPELRASHADRDRVVEELRMAAGDGRLTAEELDERLEAALTARTYSELTVLTADLPAAGHSSGATAAKPKEVMRISHRGGHVRQVGRWVVPKRIELEVAGGNARLDFTDAIITEPMLKVDAHIRGGTLRIITAPGVVVDATEVAMVGGRIVHRPISEAGERVVLAVEISGQIRGGNVRIGPPRRTLMQWLLRQPVQPRRR